MKHGQEKSDLFIIALKPTNKPGRLGAELVEPRERTEGNMGEQHTYRTLCRIKRVPEARLCTRSCSWDSSLTTRGGSPVRESRPPGSVRGASSNGCPYRDRTPSKQPLQPELTPLYLRRPAPARTYLVLPTRMQLVSISPPSSVSVRFMTFGVVTPTTRDREKPGAERIAILGLGPGDYRGACLLRQVETMF